MTVRAEGRRTTRRRVNGVFTVGLFAAVLAACSSSDESAPSSATQQGSKSADSATTVSLKLLQFAPEELSVKPGTTVTWSSAENITHTVTSGAYTGTDGPSGLRTGEKPDGLFNTKVAKKGDTATYTFAKAGSFSYYCDIHKGMNGKVIVAP